MNSNHNEHQILQHSNEINEAIENERLQGGEQSGEGNVVSLANAQVNPNFDNVISPYQVNSNYR